MMDLLKSALKAGHRADYVLFDTWFSNPKQIAAVKELKMDVIAMVKKTGKIHYRYGGEMLDISRPKRKEFLNALAQYKGGSR